jgi:hypothetical protein
MEVKEPVVAYGALSDPLEEMQNKVIAAVKELKDVKLLQRCYRMLCGVKSHKCELDLALEEVRQGKLKSYDSVDALITELNAQNEVSD